MDDLFSDPHHPFHLHHMEMALEEARLAFAKEEVPIGAVIVHPEMGVIARAHNLRETLLDPTAHAEMIALTQAAAALQTWRLERCALYVTLEPCPMCAGGIVQARVPLVFYGCADPKAGACHTLYQITSDPRLNHRCAVLGGVRAEECAGLLRQFFLERRAEGKK
jgi:tRNA(adenine34) deaminase